MDNSYINKPTLPTLYVYICVYIIYIYIYVIWVTANGRPKSPAIQLFVQPHTVFGPITKKISKLCVIGYLWGTSNAESVSLLWRHNYKSKTAGPTSVPSVKKSCLFGVTWQWLSQYPFLLQLRHKISRCASDRVVEGNRRLDESLASFSPE